MERLRPDWFLEGLWDAEYQQYRLLAYLKKVHTDFLAQRLYPPLSDLIVSYNEMARLANELLVKTESHLPDETLEEIISFSLPRLQSAIEEGKQLYEIIAQNLNVHVVGVVPLYRDEGYILLRRGDEGLVRVYSYELRHLYDDQGQQVAIHMARVGEYSFNALGMGFKTVREKILQEKRELPIPYMLAVESPWEVPLDETLLPIIRRSLPKWTQEAPPSSAT
ncbi:MAG: hypothetical protein RMJ66_06860 [Bacteroidia bacterium]|nr:hypothetical protein [Bacteroidia bacterium]MDW8134773.1 hypothetical protein [Bacteroidia bacterium]